MVHNTTEFSDVSLRAVVLTGASTPEGKPDAFCAGADLRDRDGMTDAQWLAQGRDEAPEP